MFRIQLLKKDEHFVESTTQFPSRWLLCLEIALEKSCPLQIVEIIATSNKFSWHFQPFGYFHGMDICWKSTSNLLDTSMVWKFVGSQLPTFWTLPWHGHLLEVNFQPFGYFHGMEMCWKSTSNLLDTSMVWKFVGSRNFHDLERTRFFQCRIYDCIFVSYKCRRISALKKQKYNHNAISFYS